MEYGLSKRFVAVNEMLSWFRAGLFAIKKVQFISSGRTFMSLAIRAQPTTSQYAATEHQGIVNTKESACMTFFHDKQKYVFVFPIRISFTSQKSPYVRFVMVTRCETKHGLESKSSY